jgi:hypothetical protein
LEEELAATQKMLAQLSIENELLAKYSCGFTSAILQEDITVS